VPLFVAVPLAGLVVPVVADPLAGPEVAEPLLWLPELVLVGFAHADTAVPSASATAVDIKVRFIESPLL
jgi:hypothetical protein